MALGQVSRRPAMALVIGVDGVEGVRGLFRRGETKHALPVRQELAWTRVLDDHGFTAREVARGSIAHPCVLELHAGPFRATEFPPRPRDVFLIRLGRRRDVSGQADPPS